MSSNNYILVKESKKNIAVTMRDAESGLQMGKKEEFIDLRKALRRAQALCDWEDVEYGIQVDLVGEK